MSKENNKTLEVYDKLYQSYFDGTKRRVKNIGNDAAAKKFAEECQFWLDGFSALPKNSTILEIGSANGDGSKALNKHSYVTTPSDTVDGFLSEIKRNGLEPIKLNILADKPDKKYHGCLAWHVFVHFTKKDAGTALSNIYDLLYPGGRFVFDVQNSSAEHNKDSEWIDYDGDYHLGADRFFQYYSKNDIKKIIEKTGFKIINLVEKESSSGINWFRIVLEKPNNINPKIEEYIENKIIPLYQKMAGHTDSHIRQVIWRSLNLAEQINNRSIKVDDFTGCPEHKINYDMSYVIAAFHDLGRIIDDATHEKISAKILLKDSELPKFFSSEQLNIMAEAVEDHRASNKHDPRSIYGKIISSADRNTNVDVMLKRCYDAIREEYASETKDEVIEITRKVLRNKYGGKSGYAAKKIYFKDPDFESVLDKIEKITRDPIEFKKLYNNPAA